MSAEESNSQNPVVEKIATLFIAFFMVAMFVKFMFF
jgi:hypothetical protein